jgi:hypothetical protein
LNGRFEIKVMKYYGPLEVDEQSPSIYKIGFRNRAGKDGMADLRQL